MDFKKKLKIRFWFAVVYMAIGVIMIILDGFTDGENRFLSSFGLVLLVMGAARLRNHFLITKSEESIRKQEIAETDERNIAIAEKAKSIAFLIYTLVACVAVVVFHLLEQTLVASVLSFSICVLVLIYWITYFVVQKRS